MKKQLAKQLIVSVIAILISFSALAKDADEAPRWIEKSHSIQGSWSIEEKDDGDYLILSDDFKTRKGPDLKLILSKHASADVNGDNASVGSLTIAALQAHKGSQSYKLPKGYSQYPTLLIHCEKYSKLWGASDFEHKLEN